MVLDIPGSGTIAPSPNCKGVAKPLSQAGEFEKHILLHIFNKLEPRSVTEQVILRVLCELEQRAAQDLWEIFFTLRNGVSRARRAISAYRFLSPAENYGRKKPW
jgi:hypothetical protein